VEAGGECQELGPAFRAGEFFQLEADRLVQGVGFCAPFVGGLAGLDLCVAHDASPRRFLGLYGTEIV
jgi:hypothetical protein